MPPVPEKILHQADVEEVIDDRAAKKGTATIASPSADAASLKTAVDAIRAALTASGVTS